jgi:hypothetical protein
MLRDAAPLPGEAQWTHKNCYTLKAGVRMAFSGLLKASAQAGEVALDGTKRSLEVMLSVCACIRNAWANAAAHVPVFFSATSGTSDAITMRHQCF